MNYTLSRIKWNETAAGHLRKAAGPVHPEEYERYLSRLVRSEKAALIAVLNEEGDHVASVIVQDQVSVIGITETVLIATGGRDSRRLFPRVYPLLEEALKAHGAKWLRMHAIRKGTAYWAKKFSFFGVQEGSEMVFRKALI